jgi:hypothetical protein
MVQVLPTLLNTVISVGNAHLCGLYRTVHLYSNRNAGKQVIFIDLLDLDSYLNFHIVAPSGFYRIYMNVIYFI